MPAIRIVKVGGSLFDWPELPLALDSWLNEQPSATNVLIVGGGKLADAIRSAGQAFSLDEEAAHWLAIDAMSINARLVVGLLIDAVLISTLRDLKTTIENNSRQRIVFDVREFLHEHESNLSGSVLPHDWSVTSDSIAARMAEVLTADELVLLKSTDPPGDSATLMSDYGFVDRNFPAFDRCHFRRRFVNLRHFALSSPAANTDSPGHNRVR